MSPSDMDFIDGLKKADETAKNICPKCHLPTEGTSDTRDGTNLCWCPTTEEEDAFAEDMEWANKDVFIFAPDPEPVDEDEPERPRYQSQEGFVKRPTLRGFTEIQPLWRELLKHEGKAFICGGYVRYMCSPRQDPVKAGDIDIYCRDLDTFEAVRGHFAESGLDIKHENEVAVTYRRPRYDSTNVYRYVPPIQLIKPENKGAIVATGTMEEILQNFDFTVIRGGLLSPEEALVDADFDHDEGVQTLRIKNIHCPISSTLRCMKYAEKGYFLSTGETLKLFLDWENRDQEYRDEIVHKLGMIGKGSELTKEQIDQLEALMRVD